MTPMPCTHPTAARGRDSLAPVEIDAGDRQAIWLHTAATAASPCDELEHSLGALFPWPVNDYISTPPKRRSLQAHIDTLTQTMAVFDLLGWEIDEQAESITVPANMAPALGRLLADARADAAELDALREMAGLGSPPPARRCDVEMATSDGLGGEEADDGR